MNSELARKIVESSEGSDSEMQLYSGYSGRGMYGKTTCAIVAQNMTEFIKSALVVAFEQGRSRSLNEEEHCQKV
jgi:hypothetical protein